MRILSMTAVLALAAGLSGCGRNGAGEKERSDLRRENEMQIAEIKGDYQRLVSDLRQEISAGELEIEDLEKELAIKVASRVFFESGSDALKKESHPLLLRVAKGLQAIKGRQFLIGGHADDIRIGEKLQGRFETNWELSAARAVKVARFLNERGGVDAGLLMAVGYGSSRPLRTNATTKGRMQNRRIEILIVHR